MPSLPPLSIPRPNPLFVAAHREPKSIDTLLQHSGHLFDSTLATDLSVFIHEQVSLTVTPEVYWGNEENVSRTPSYYVSCMVHATILGRAYALLSHSSQYLDDSEKGWGYPFTTELPVELRLNIYEHYIEKRRQLENLWTVMEDIFAKALFSGPYPEPGSRYVVAILILTCGKALSQTPDLQGKGRNYVWYNGEYSESNSPWDWEELRSVVVETARESRDKHDIQQLLAHARQGEHNLDYVPKEAADALGFAVEHLETDQEDLTSEQVVDLLFSAIGQVDLAQHTKDWVEEWKDVK